jgi:hypothetical protein
VYLLVSGRRDNSTGRKLTPVNKQSRMHIKQENRSK